MSEILYADDDPAMRAMVDAVLRAGGFRVRLAENGADALREVRHQPPDLVLLDYHMGHPDGFEVCQRIKTDPRLHHLPVLILTGQAEVENRLRGFAAGADDYLPKPFDPRELTARVRALLRLTHHALDRNPTTGIPGSVAVEREFERRCERGEPLAVCYFDLDHFKPFADRFGFNVADEAIRRAGAVLHEAAEGRDAFVGHIGGDDFIVICEPGSARPLAEVARRRFLERLSEVLPDIVATGHYRGKDREEREREFAITNFSVAIVHIGAGRCRGISELGGAVAEAKRRAKQPGSSGIEEVELDGASAREGA
jgi:PleD family two-component response regulator